MAIPANRNWFAWDNTQPPGPPRLHVTSQVETPSGHKVPRLKRGVQGINPKILILDLGIVETGKPGIELVAFRRAHYEEPVDPGQFSQVQINWEGSKIQLIDVESVV